MNRKSFPKAINWREQQRMFWSTKNCQSWYNLIIEVNPFFTFIANVAYSSSNLNTFLNHNSKINLNMQLVPKMHPLFQTHFLICFLICKQKVWIKLQNCSFWYFGKQPKFCYIGKQAIKWHLVANGGLNDFDGQNIDFFI